MGRSAVSGTETSNSQVSNGHASAVRLRSVYVGWALFVHGVAVWSTVRSIRPLLTPTLALSFLCAVAGIFTLHRMATTRPPSPRGWPRWLWAAVGVSMIGSYPLLADTYRFLLHQPASTQTEISLGVHSNLSLVHQTVARRDFTDRDLRSSSFTGSTLVDVSFLGANLSESDLRDAVFDEVNFSGANLCGADIRGADFTQAVGLDSVVDWSYVLYDDETRVPKPINLGVMGGPIPDTGVGHRYMCEVGRPRVVHR
jgi:hypothetical protein